MQISSQSNFLVSALSKFIHYDDIIYFQVDFADIMTTFLAFDSTLIAE